MSSNTLLRPKQTGYISSKACYIKEITYCEFVLIQRLFGIFQTNMLGAVRPISRYLGRKYKYYQTYAYEKTYLQRLFVKWMYAYYVETGEKRSQWYRRFLSALDKTSVLKVSLTGKINRSVYGLVFETLYKKKYL